MISHLLIIWDVVSSARAMVLNVKKIVEECDTPQACLTLNILRQFMAGLEHHWGHASKGHQGSGLVMRSSRILTVCPMTW